MFNWILGLGLILLVITLLSVLNINAQKARDLDSFFVKEIQYNGMDCLLVNEYRMVAITCDWDMK